MPAELDALTLARVASQGWLLSLGLIVAIGAQNAFVLRQGLRREHVAPIVVLCAASDAVLMALGVFGMAGLMRAAPWLTQALAAAGVLFLAGYAMRSWRAAWRPHRLAPGEQPSLGRRAALAQAAAFTYLNPHVYLDTVLLVGAVGAQHATTNLRLVFWLGAATASAMWFTALGWSAQWLAPWLARPTVWRVLDFGIGCAMAWIAWHLLPMAFGQAPA